jgi:hypothetical protein
VLLEERVVAFVRPEDEVVAMEGLRRLEDAYAGLSTTAPAVRSESPRSE